LEIPTKNKTNKTAKNKKPRNAFIAWEQAPGGASAEQTLIRRFAKRWPL